MTTPMERTESADSPFPTNLNTPSDDPDVASFPGLGLKIFSEISEEMEQSKNIRIEDLAGAKTELENAKITKPGKQTQLKMRPKEQLSGSVSSPSYRDHNRMAQQPAESEDTLARVIEPFRVPRFIHNSPPNHANRKRVSSDRDALATPLPESDSEDLVERDKFSFGRKNSQDTPQQNEDTGRADNEDDVSLGPQMVPLPESISGISTVGTYVTKENIALPVSENESVTSSEDLDLSFASAESDSQGMLTPILVKDNPLAEDLIALEESTAYSAVRESSNSAIDGEIRNSDGDRIRVRDSELILDDEQPSFAFSVPQTPQATIPMALRVLCFVPWCALVGGAIFLFPGHLERITFAPGYLASPTGIHRFAHWSNFAYQHAFIFLGSIVLLFWVSASGGSMVLGGVLAQFCYAWWNFVPDETIPLGEDDRQSLYLVAKHYGLVEQPLAFRKTDEGYFATKYVKGENEDDDEDDDEGVDVRDVAM